MKSNLYFTKYLLKELIEVKNPSEYFFFLFAKLSPKDKFTLISRGSVQLQVLYAEQLHKILRKALTPSTSFPKILYYWVEKGSKNRIISMLTQNFLDYKSTTIILNMMEPVYDYVKRERDFILCGDIILNKRDELERTAVNMVESYLINNLRRSGLTEMFEAENNDTYWKRKRVYK